MILLYRHILYVIRVLHLCTNMVGWTFDLFSKFLDMRALPPQRFILILMIVSCRRRLILIRWLLCLVEGMPPDHFMVDAHNVFISVNLCIESHGCFGFWFTVIVTLCGWLYRAFNDNYTKSDRKVNL